MLCGISEKRPVLGPEVTGNSQVKMSQEGIKSWHDLDKKGSNSYNIGRRLELKKQMEGRLQY